MKPHLKKTQKNCTAATQKPVATSKRNQRGNRARTWQTINIFILASRRRPSSLSFLQFFQAGTAEMLQAS